MIFLFLSHLNEPQKTLESILNTKTILLAGHIQAVYYHSILKIVTYIMQSLDNDEILIKQLISTTIDKISAFLASGDVETQERVGCRIIFRWFNIRKTKTFF